MEYPRSAWERIMKTQEVFQRAYQRTITWKEAAEILNVDERTTRRWKSIVEEDGYKSLLDKRRRRPSPKRAPEKARNDVIGLYRDIYKEWNVKHFHEQLLKRGIKYQYTWTKNVLQEAGLVAISHKRTVHRKKRDRKPLVGMMLHIDGSDHEWIPDLSPKRQTLIPILDDANNEVYHAQLVDEEGTKECMEGLKEVVLKKGVFCSVYSDRAGHFFHTPTAGGKVDLGNLTQIGRALYELGIRMIPAYSPEARGRGERLNETWQGRLPNELKLHGIKTVIEANRYIRDTFRLWHNKDLKKTPLESGSAFTAYRGKNLDYVFSVKEDRMVNHDNTVQWNNLILQIEPSKFRISFAKCRVTVHDHLDNTLSIVYGPHVIGRYNILGKSLKGIILKNPSPIHINSQIIEVKQRGELQLAC